MLCCYKPIIHVVTFLIPLASNSKKTKRTIGHAFSIYIHLENQNQMSFHPFILYEIIFLVELILEYLYYLLDMPF